MPQTPRDVFGFYKGFILCHFKGAKDVSCKASQLSIFRLWIFGPNGPFKSAATTQKCTKWSKIAGCSIQISCFWTNFLCLKKMVPLLKYSWNCRFILFLSQISWGVHGKTFWGEWCQGWMIWDGMPLKWISKMSK